MHEGGLSQREVDIWCIYGDSSLSSAILCICQKFFVFCVLHKYGWTRSSGRTLIWFLVMIFKVINNSLQRWLVTEATSTPTVNPWQPFDYNGLFQLQCHLGLEAYLAWGRGNFCRRQKSLLMRLMFIWTSAKDIPICASHTICSDWIFYNSKTNIFFSSSGLMHDLNFWAISVHLVKWHSFDSPA